jgi:hypothetical protein
MYFKKWKNIKNLGSRKHHMFPLPTQNYSFSDLKNKQTKYTQKNPPKHPKTKKQTNP